MPQFVHIAHSPVGPTGRLVWEDFSEMLAAIEATGWSGLVSRYTSHRAAATRTDRYVNGIRTEIIRTP